MRFGKMQGPSGKKMEKAALRREIGIFTVPGPAAD